jgi:DDB1- and CUL4-associated factor 5
VCLHLDTLYYCVLTDPGCPRYSGGADNVILKYDMLTARELVGSPSSSFIGEYRDHDVSTLLLPFVVPRKGVKEHSVGERSSSYVPSLRGRGISQRQVRSPLVLSPNPIVNVSISSEDGKLVLHDGRAGSRMSAAQGTLQHTAEFTGVQHHPVMEHIFATSDVHGQVCLRDTRMAFGPSSKRSNNGIVRVVRLHP